MKREELREKRLQQPYRLLESYPPLLVGQIEAERQQQQAEKKGKKSLLDVPVVSCVLRQLNRLQCVPFLASFGPFFLPFFLSPNGRLSLFRFLYFIAGETDALSLLLAETPSPLVEYSSACNYSVPSRFQSFHNLFTAHQVVLELKVSVIWAYYGGHINSITQWRTSTELRVQRHFKADITFHLFELTVDGQAELLSCLCIFDFYPSNWGRRCCIFMSKGHGEVWRDENWVKLNLNLKDASFQRLSTSLT